METQFLSTGGEQVRILIELNKILGEAVIQNLPPELQGKWLQWFGHIKKGQNDTDMSIRIKSPMG